MTPSEIYVPCVLWGAGVEEGVTRTEPRSVMDVAPTISFLLGVSPPAQSVGRVLVDPAYEDEDGPVAVVIPAYNERESLPGVLDAIPRTTVNDLNIIVVDDGSTDDTASLAAKHGADWVVRHDHNRGLGAALRTGLAKAQELNAKATIYLDADGEYDPECIPDVLAPVLSGRADYVLGSRYLGTREGQRWLRLIPNLIFTVALWPLTGRFITDGQTGMRAFSRKAVQAAEIVHDYNYAQVITLRLLRRGMRLAEVPINYRRRQHGASFIRPEYLWKVPMGIFKELLSS